MNAFNIDRMLRFAVWLICVVWLDLVVLCGGMFAKNEQQWERVSHDAPERRFRANIQELVADNSISARRAVSLLEDAAYANAEGVSSFLSKSRRETIKKCRKARKWQASSRKNACRDLLQRMRHKHSWPRVYALSLPVYDPKTQQVQLQKCAMWLPHELLWHLADQNDLEAVIDEAAIEPGRKAKLDELKAVWGCNQALACGLWIDGCPCNWDRSSSLEVMTLNILNVNAQNKALRLPLFVMPKKYIAKQETFQAALSVVAWSFQQAAAGVWPAARHDGTAWNKCDRFRAKKSGAPLGVNAFLLELRGDWLMYKEVFGFPAWNEKAGCCIRCSVTPDTMRSFGTNAPWLQPDQRLDHWSFLARQLRLGKPIPPVFACPGFDMSAVSIDWLHCADLGVAPDWLGNFLFALQSRYPGASMDARLSNVFLALRAYYAANRIENRLDNLTMKMLRKKGGSCPKLRCSAAEARSLIGFARVEAETHFNTGTLLDNTILNAAIELHNCYGCLSNFDTLLIKSSATKFALLYSSLEQYAAREGLHAWKIKPKMHMWLELCYSGVNPREQWVYRDEDFGGFAARMFRRKGGKWSSWAAGNVFFARFASKQTLRFR